MADNAWDVEAGAGVESDAVFLIRFGFAREGSNLSKKREAKKINRMASAIKEKRATIISDVHWMPSHVNTLVALTNPPPREKSPLYSG